ARGLAAVLVAGADAELVGAAVVQARDAVALQLFPPPAVLGVLVADDLVAPGVGGAVVEGDLAARPGRRGGRGAGRGRLDVGAHGVRPGARRSGADLVHGDDGDRVLVPLGRVLGE